jgi:hypothetical protein
MARMILEQKPSSPKEPSVGAGTKAVEGLPPDFLLRPVALMICMRFSLRRAAHVVVASSCEVGNPLRPSFSSHVRWGERGAPVWSCGIRERLEGETRGIPHLAKNERDVGHPALVAWDRAQKRVPGPPTQRLEVAA